MKALVSKQSKQDAVTTPSRARRPRVPEVDWLRTLIVLAIIPYHGIALFSAASATVLRNTFSDATLSIVIGALQAWGIALIFLLAGASSKFALDVRSPVTYAKERLLRLLVPMALAMLILAPLRAYYLLLSNPNLIRVSPRPIAHPEQLQNIVVFFQRYWGSLLTTGSPIVVTNALAHLWFVPRLLIASLICVPLFLFLRARWPRWMARTASSRTLTTVLLLGAGFVPTFVVAALQPGWLHRLTAGLALNEDWTAFALEFVMFIYGYLLYSSASLRATVRRLAYGMLALSGICWGIVFLLRITGNTPPNNYSPSAILFALTQVFAIWLLTAAVIGLAMRYLTESPAWQQYLTTAAFPVFILHLPVLAMAAYYLQALPVPWYVLLLLIIVVTFVVSFALYEYVVRRVPFLCFLFGLKSPQQKAQ